MSEYLSAGISADLRDQIDSLRKDIDDALVFSEAVAKARIPMLVVDYAGVPVRANHAACLFFGYTERELREMPYPTFTHPDYIDADVHQYKTLQDGDITWYRMKKAWIHKHGHYVWAMLTVVSIASQALHGAALVFITPLTGMGQTTGSP